MTGIGDRIRSIRGTKTQKAFADSLGISTQAVINYERHGRTPKQQVLNKISNVYGINVDWLLTGTGAMSLQEVPESGAGTFVGKMGDTSPVLMRENGQPVENPGSEKNKMGEVSPILPQELTARCLRLADENAALLRENGDLRVEVERLRHQLEQVKEAGPADDALLAKLVQENKDLRARLRAFERAGVAVPPVTDRVQETIKDFGHEG